jgi:hypothetical protein
VKGLEAWFQQISGRRVLWRWIVAEIRLTFSVLSDKKAA